MTTAGFCKRVIPILGCPDIRVQVAFYQALGFRVLATYTSPNPYASLEWGGIELHFYGSRKIIPAQNPAMCFLWVQDVDETNRAFTARLKEHLGKIPRAGFPKITPVRSPAYDRRFTLTDPGGNTLYIGAQPTPEDRFFRTLDSQEYARLFTVLYDILYSKEDPELADSMLPRYTAMANNLRGLDRAKYLLILSDIQMHLGRKPEDDTLVMLIKEQEQQNPEDWKKIRQKYLEILQNTTLDT